MAVFHELAHPVLHYELSLSLVFLNWSGVLGTIFIWFEEVIGFYPRPDCLESPTHHLRNMPVSHIKTISFKAIP